MIVKETHGYVWLTEFAEPVTTDQYDQMVLNDKIASALVRRANTVDLTAIAARIGKDTR